MDFKTLIDYRTPAQLLADAQSYIQSMGYKVNGLARGTVAAALKGASYVVGKFGYDLLVDDVLPNLWPQFAKTLTALALHRDAYGLPAKNKLYLEGYVTFSRADTSAIGEVPAGAWIGTETDANGKTYRVVVTTTTQAAIGVGTLDVPVRAENAGSAYNLPANSYTQISGVSGWDSATNVDRAGDDPPFYWITQEGSDDEELEAMRLRVLAAPRENRMMATDAVYEGWALEIDGVTQAVVQRDTARAATGVDIRIATATGPASQSLIDQVQAHLDGNRPTTDDVLVASFSWLDRALTVAVSVKPATTTEQMRRIRERCEAVLRVMLWSPVAVADPTIEKYEVGQNYRAKGVGLLLIGHLDAALKPLVLSVDGGSDITVADDELIRLTSLAVTVTRASAL